MTLKYLAGFCVGLFLSGPGFAEATRTIIVMDGSGSMWGQIDGRTKLEIARETLSGVLGTIPADQELGLMAYGHRERGNCADIELMVPPAPGTAADITARVNEMRFQGKTPLTDAVRQAAAALRSGEEAATVVLVTDGLETCEADPCALARELEASGLAFTAHVIGFGLTKEEGAQVACLATETGGQYLQASDARALSDALVQTVTAAAAPQPPPADPAPTALLTAPASAPQGSRIMVGWAGPRSTYDYIRIFDASGTWLTETAVGSENPLELQLPWATGDFTLAYVLESEAISETIPISLTAAQVGITAPDKAQVGQEVTITWVGPGAFLDNIQLLNDDSGERWGYDYTDGKDSMVWTMPDAPGNYSFAYVFRDSEVIHRKPIIVTLDKVEAEEPAAPAPVAGPTPVPVSFAGAGTGDFPLAITWSATPAAGQDLPPEAWAMADSMTGPIRADFLPGTYDVLGDAGDTVFAGQVTVTADGPNDFVIPVSADLSPAGPDAPPVSVTLTGPYVGTLRQWAAISLPDGTALRSEGETGTPWEVALSPGSWLITAIASGAAGEGLAAVVDITADMSGPAVIEIGQPTFATTPFTDITPFHQQCMGDVPCTYHDPVSDLRAVLLPGWLMQDPYTLTTATGEGGGLPSTLFGTAGTGETILAALNPRQWDATIGPCEDIAAGQLCHAADMPGDAMAGLRVIAATARITSVAPSATAGPDAAAPEPARIEGTPLDLTPEAAATLRNRLLGQP